MIKDLITWYSAENKFRCLEKNYAELIIYYTLIEKCQSFSIV